jgi:hypothetical protein
LRNIKSADTPRRAGATGGRSLPRCRSCRARGPLYTRGVDTVDFFSHAQYWGYRLGVFVVLNVLDDPAWLALIFC